MKHAMNTQKTYQNIIAFFLCLSVLSVSKAAAQEPSHFFDIPIEELSSMAITTVSKREEKIMESPSAVYTLTAEQIKYSGAKKLTDIFRMVPGVDVVDINAYYTGVQARGFAFFPKYARQSLVLIDGRTVYSPQINTTFWDQVPVFLENIERIEVIRGPNAALYGANAFNSVINIITMNPEKTRGLFFSAAAGNREAAWTTARIGGKSGNLCFRATAGYQETEGFGGTRNWFRKPQATLRADYRIDSSSMLSFHSGYAGGDREMGPDDDPEVTSYFLLAKYEKRLNSENLFQIQYYHDYRNSAFTFGHDDKLRTDDVEIQFNRNSETYDLVCGAGYRIDRVRHGFLSGENYLAYAAKGPRNLNSETRYNHILKTFVNLTWHISNRLHVSAALMMEDNRFVKELMFSPKGSIVYLPGQNHSLRFSISRAYRTPSFIEESAFFTVPFSQAPGYIGQKGNSSLSPERIVAFELGYRGIFLNNRMTISTEIFYHDINNLIIYDDDGTSIFEYKNARNNTVKGIELSFSLKAAHWWDLRFHYTYQEGSDDLLDGYIIEQKAGLINRFYLPKGLVLNTQLFYVDQFHFEAEPFTPESTVHDYTRLDIRLSRTFLSDHLEIAVIGQNLLDTRHQEYPEALGAAEATRTYFLELRYTFGN